MTTPTLSWTAARHAVLVAARDGQVPATSSARATSAAFERHGILVAHGDVYALTLAGEELLRRFGRARREPTSTAAEAGR